MEERLISKRLKEIRRSKRLTLEKLAELTNLSKSYLSEIENSDQPPPIYTLSRISKAFGIDIADLFTKTPAVPYQAVVVGRGNEHNVIAKRSGYGYVYDDLAPNKKGKNMEPFIVTVGFESNVDIATELCHDGEEFNYVLEGMIEFFYEGKSHAVLEAGDHVYFDAEKPHSARSVGDKPAKVLIVMYSYKRL